MRVVAQWLADLGLGEYAQAFAAQDIDAAVLPELTRADLGHAPRPADGGNGSS